MHNPSVFIAMATSILGGPGKGLEQFFRYGGLEGCKPLLANYVIENEDEQTEFVSVMKKTGVSIVPLYQKKFFDFDLIDQSLAYIKDNNIELLQSHGYKSHMLCYLLHRKTKLPWVAFVHGWTQENIRVRLYAALEQALLLGATEVVAVSESLRSRLMAPVRKRAHVIPNALASTELTVTRTREAVRQELGIKDDALVIGIVGRLSPEKSHALFFKALANLRAQGISVHALVVGQGQEYDALQELVTSLQLQDACSFVGHVRDTANYYNAMDIQAMPSTTEGMPNAALEGMHMGLPLVATHVGGIPEVVLHEETGILIPSGDESALTAALLRFAKDPSLRQRMGKAGQDRIKAHFDPHVRVKRILGMYAKVLGK